MKRKALVRLTILLLLAAAEALQGRGRKSGMFRTKFAATLIEHIVHDDVYAAVIDVASSDLHNSAARRRS